MGLFVCFFFFNESGGLLGVQVVAELLLGLVLCMWAALTVPGKFLSIQPNSEENRYGFFPCSSFKFKRFSFQFDGMFY